MQEILIALERALFEERSAIKKLDTPAIDSAATKKIELEAKLSAAIARGERPTKEGRVLLERVRAMARANQLLLISKLEIHSTAGHCWISFAQFMHRRTSVPVAPQSLLPVSSFALAAKSANDEPDLVSLW